MMWTRQRFELIEPKGKGRRDVNVPARMAGEPSSDLVVLVGGVVVNDEADVELRRHWRQLWRRKARNS